jgi:hypothetical protein
MFLSVGSVISFPKNLPEFLLLPKKPCFYAVLRHPAAAYPDPPSLRVYVAISHGTRTPVFMLRPSSPNCCLPGSSSASAGSRSLPA